jgi:hypothetical protein
VIAASRPGAIERRLSPASKLNNAALDPEQSRYDIEVALVFENAYDRENLIGCRTQISLLSCKE